MDSNHSGFRTRHGAGITAAGCAVTVAVIYGCIGTFPLFLPEIVRDTGYSISQVAMISTICGIFTVPANLVVGKLIRRIGARYCLLAGGALCFTHFTLFALSNSLVSMYFTAGIAGFVLGFGTAVPCSVLITKWFDQKRTVMISMMMSAMLFGNALTAPLAGQLIAGFGWRRAYLLLASASLVIVTAMTVLVMRESPAGEARESAPSPETLHGIPLVQARRKTSFWVLAAAMLPLGTLIYGLKVFITDFWQVTGMDPVRSSSYLGLFALLSGVGVILSGIVNQRYGTVVYITSAVAAFIAGVGMLLLGGGTAHPVFLLVTLILLGLSAALQNSVPAMLVPYLFGKRDFAAMAGLFQGCFTAGFAVIPLVMGAVVDRTGSYTAAFILLMAIAAIGLGMVLLAFWLHSTQSANDFG